MKVPATTLEEAYAAVELFPLESGDPRYVDCAQVRGGPDTRLDEVMGWRIEVAKQPVHQLLSGHRGCGKSTELLRLAQRLRDKGYFVIYFAADEDIDVGDVEYTDVLLSIVKRLERALAEEGIEVDPELVRSILLWFAEVVYGWTDEREVERILEAEFGLGAMAPLPLIAKMLARLTGHIKTGRQVRREVRLKLDPQISQLLERANLFIHSALTDLKKKGWKDLVILIDNLDRIALRVLDERTGRTSHDAVYLEHADQLKALDAHIIYTVPISMFYSLKATQLTGAFPKHFILPMIKVQEEDGRPCEEGIAILREVAEKRIDVERLFAPGVVEYLAAKSGGMIRDFIRLLGYTIEMASARGGKLPIEKTIAEGAFQRLVNEYGRMVPDEHFPLLARVHREKRVKNDASHQAMLYNLSVLEYLDGERWCDVHPAVLELREFKEAWERERGIAH